MNRKYKTLALVTVLCAPLLAWGLHDTQPWAGTPTFHIDNGTTLEIDCAGTQRTPGGDMPRPISSVTYCFNPKFGFAHTHRRGVMVYDAVIDQHVTEVWNDYAYGPFRSERCDEEYLSARPPAR